MHYSSYIGQKDSLKGRYGSIENGPLGSLRPLYIDYGEDDEEEFDLLDDVDSDTQEIIAKQINRDMNTAIGLEPQRRDMGSLASYQVFGEQHTTVARNTIAPFSNKQLYPNGLGPVLGVGGTDQAFKTTGNFRHIGSESGYVDPGTVMFGEDDEPLYDIRNIDDPMERSFKKHQQNIKNVLDEINECLRDN